MKPEISSSSIRFQTISLNHSIDSFLQSALEVFYSYPYPPYPYEEYRQIIIDPLKENMHSYFDSKIGELPSVDYLFNNLTLIWKTYQLNGHVSSAQEFWLDILKIVNEWETGRSLRIHKGSIYYFWSQTAILQGQFEKGFFLIHSAYNEDVLTHNSDLPKTPAFKTVSLDYSDPNNLLFTLVKIWANYLDNFVTNYSQLYSRTFVIDDFRTKFLTNPPNRDILFSFTYNLARSYEFDNLPNFVYENYFTGLFELNILFDLILVVDNFIYSKLVNPGPTDWRFYFLANHLLIKSGLSINQQTNSDHLSFLNRQNDFDLTITNLLNKTLIYPDGVHPSDLECDIAIAYCLRNFSAHRISSSSVIQSRFSEIRQSVFNTVFLAVEVL